MSARDGFPRQYARTQGFTLGVPRDLCVSPDGARVVFLRAPSSTDARTGLWVLTLGDGTERLLADPVALGPAGDGGPGAEPAEARARRERVRERASGIVGYATDRAVRLAAFALGGALFVVDLITGAVHRLPAKEPVLDPRPDAVGSRIAYVSGGSLRVITLDGSLDRCLAEPEETTVTFGLAEFVAAEEMHRRRGYWWAPDGKRLLTTRVDVSPVTVWHITDPAHPERPARSVRYPAAGTANARVTLHLLTLDGDRSEVPWDHDAFPYLTHVDWSRPGPALIQLQSRDQRRTQVVSLDGDTGATTRLGEDRDPAWVDIVPGVPALTTDGRLVQVVADAGAHRLVVGTEALTGAPLQVQRVLDVADDVCFVATDDDPTAETLHVAGREGVRRLLDEPGRHGGVRSGDVLVTQSVALDRSGTLTRVWRRGKLAATIASHAEVALLTPTPQLLVVGRHELRCALLLPTGHRPGSRRLPVLLDPYGGPAQQRVVAARDAYLVSQWFADQGFAVLVADGRGTPGRGPDWDRLVHLDQATPNLEDQVLALEQVSARFPDLDTGRVAIRGWSHGGYLAALAVLRRPDLFHAAIAGAPVTDFRLYDTHYTERFLGHPQARPDVYNHHSLLADAPSLQRPLLLIHGFADDNVMVAHTLQLSAALLAAGHPHAVLPLTDATHMASQPVVAENLLWLQLEFLTRTLGVRPRAGSRDDSEGRTSA
ncbi:MAG TPA: prolyl oligopeptidase family serine peptidase [Verrucomicrobiae bacterium]|nr:prolyl oligopeptidase family serine peptidase [Verrucomicrobiae bacterium]